MKRALLLVLTLALVADLSAFHIIGGEITYECLGDGTYKFTMKIYRDCRDQGMQVGQLDQQAPIGIYRNGTTLVTVLHVTLLRASFIDPPDFPCLIPPENLCVEEGVYEWEYTFEEWPIKNTYTVEYQRCCRNNTIVNIVGPAQAGATYFVDLNEEAQQVCNSSPVFKEFPPTVVCVNSDINFDHSAVDPDGDSLVYAFCHPVKGGGFRMNQNNPGSCDGPRPDPPCPAPFERVAFKSPYNVNSPMAGDPVIMIDPETGLISGKPQLIGQFVMGVCVKEYRNGQLLGEIKRDFQFNVADCDPTVFAKVRSDATLGAKEYIINSCGNNTILFENESTLERFIGAYRWEFDINSRREIRTTKDAEITFPGLGTYRGTMIVNPGLDCGDTAEIYVNLYPSITADFTFDYDTCIGGPTVFIDGSSTGAMQIESWSWQFGEGGSSDVQHPVYTYPIPGNHPVSLTVTDDNECQDTKEVILPYFPVPPLLVIEPSSFIGCAPADIFFNNLSIPIDSTYTIDWDFGDGQHSAEVSPFHQYDDPGIFSVGLEIMSPIGCQTSAFFPDWIQVKESPNAAFVFSPEQPSNFNPTVQFTNFSVNHRDQQWLFDRVGRSSDEHPIFTFPDTGRFQVALIAIHENGCRDTSAQLLDVIPRVTYHMPNAFTPNGDGKNDLFIGTGFVEGMQDFELGIWSRWGELLFLTNNPSEAWNGSKGNVGEVLPAGVYVYQLKYTDPRGEKISFNGFATLVK